MPRTRSEKWMSFEEAKEFIQDQQVQSRQQFLDWHDENKPKALSKYPQRVYTKEWNGWNDFLGTNNEFNKTRRNWRSLEEAILWVHKLNLIGGKPAWLSWVKENSDNLPEDIPKRPDITYKRDWMSWKHWLGDTVAEKVEAQQQAQSTAIYYIIREREYAGIGNIYTFGIESGGVSGLRDRWNVEKFQVVRMYEFNSQKTQEVDTIVNNLSTPHYGSINIRAVPNIHDLCWDLVNVLDQIT